MCKPPLTWYTFLWQARKIKNTSLLSLQKQSAWVQLRGSHWQAFHLKANSMKQSSILSWQLSYIKQVEVLFPYWRKFEVKLSLHLFYEPWLWYIANQSGSAKEAVSLKIGKNIEMLACFICVRTQDRILIDIVIIYYYIYSSFSVDKLKYIINIIQKHIK